LKRGKDRASSQNYVSETVGRGRGGEREEPSCARVGGGGFVNRNSCIRGGSRGGNKTGRKAAPIRIWGPGPYAREEIDVRKIRRMRGQTLLSSSKVEDKRELRKQTVSASTTH